MSFESVEDIIKFYTKGIKPMETWEEAEESRYDRMDQDAVEEDRQYRFNQRLQRNLINMDRDYPDSYHRQDVIALLQGDMDTDADEPHHHLEGIVDISEGED